MITNIKRFCIFKRWTDSQEVLINKFDNNSDSKLLELENVLKEKKDTINNLKETQSALQNQISNLNSEIDKLKRIAAWDIPN